MITVIGDAIIDRYLYGSWAPSPEEPGSLFSLESVTHRAGGAANVKANIESLGEACGLFAPTTRSHKTRYVIDGQVVFRADDDATGHLHRWPQRRGIMVLSDYGKGAISGDLVRYLTKDGEATVIADPKVIDERFRGVDVLKPNRKAASRYVGFPLDDPESIEAACKLLLKLCRSVVITLGEDGLAVVTDRTKMLLIYAERVEVADTIGAGDTVLAALAVGIHNGMSLEDAARFANSVAAVSVQKQGTSVVTRDEIDCIHERVF